jgi:hypothetical protein
LLAVAVHVIDEPTAAGYGELGVIAVTVVTDGGVQTTSFENGLSSPLVLMALTAKYARRDQSTPWGGYEVTFPTFTWVVYVPEDVP